MIHFEKLRNFLVQQLRIEEHSVEEQNEILQKLKDLVEAQINRAVVDLLTEEDQQEAEKFKKQNDPAAFYDFLQRKVPNLPFVIESVGTKTLKDYGIELES